MIAQAKQQTQHHQQQHMVDNNNHEQQSSHYNYNNVMYSTIPEMDASTHAQVHTYTGTQQTADMSEWKVRCARSIHPIADPFQIKRRSDGSRYITRKPLRTRLLKERAEQLMQERVGVTTDDDAISELKVSTQQIV
jgi:hypothetical protein